jgi:hypothetical protein
MTAPYREPEMPRHERRVRWDKIAQWVFAAVAFLAALIGVRVGCLYLKAHPSPPSPTEEDKRKGAEQEASEALRAAVPGRWSALHCVDNGYAEYVSGCNFRSHGMFDCTAWSEGTRFFLQCRDGLSPGMHGCIDLTMQRVPSLPTEAK